MIPLSCANCWYNALQTDSVGSDVGYCTRKKKLLFASEQTTCGLQTRKDLVYEDAMVEQALHLQRFAEERIVFLSTGDVVNGEVSERPRDLARVRREPVGSIVLDYGELHTSIESIARLRQIRSGLAEMAMLTLARGFVRNCIEHGGAWTSGVHMFWWTRERLAAGLELGFRDIRHLSMPLDEQLKIAEWSLIMLRLFFVSDIGYHASNHPLSQLRDLPDEAAMAVEKLEPAPLLRWIKRVLLPRIDELLPREEYTRLSQELYREPRAS